MNIRKSRLRDSACTNACFRAIAPYLRNNAV
uniref:Uncharacterized protein n=1 Tax=Neisseria meningitidis alpha153 TaxID=663926 RepID=C6SBW9_NEIME|nr:hypothetical protein predicted by Glimmer/Critica [Neisseria meningitidis alpha153]